MIYIIIYHITMISMISNVLQMSSLFAGSTGHGRWGLGGHPFEEGGGLAQRSRESRFSTKKMKNDNTISKNDENMMNLFEEF